MYQKKLEILVSMFCSDIVAQILLPRFKWLDCWQHFPGKFSLRKEVGKWMITIQGLINIGPESRNVLLQEGQFGMHMTEPQSKVGFELR